MFRYLNDKLILSQVVPVFEDCNILLVISCLEGQSAGLQGRLEQWDARRQDASHVDLQSEWIDSHEAKY